MTIPKLCSLCENILMQNYQQLKDLGDTRYELIKKVLGRFNAQQLMDLEVINPKLLLDDEETWFNLVKREFPQDVHERFTTNISKIKQFFKLQLDEVGFDFNSIDLNNYIQIQQLGDSNTKKYKLPSKLLYLKYKEDYIKKEELAIENLRQRMKAIKKDKEQNQLVHIDDVVEIGNKRSKPALRKPERSKIFMKSQNEVRYRNTLFKNPLGGDSKIEKPAPRIRAPRSSINRISIPKPKPAPIPLSPVQPPIITSPTKANTSTTPTTSVNTPKSPIRPKITTTSPIRKSTPSIFNVSRPRIKPKIKSTDSIVSSINESLNPIQNSQTGTNGAETPSEPPKKKININEYKARKK